MFPGVHLADSPLYGMAAPMQDKANLFRGISHSKRRPKIHRLAKFARPSVFLRRHVISARIIISCHIYISGLEWTEASIKGPSISGLIYRSVAFIVQITEILERVDGWGECTPTALGQESRIIDAPASISARVHLKLNIPRPFAAGCVVSSMCSHRGSLPEMD
jgi:hypothetical protein